MRQAWDKTIKQLESFEKQVPEMIIQAQSVAVQLDQKDNLLLEVQLFLGDLPNDLGKGSLNGWKVQLQEKIRSNVKM